MVFMKVTSSFWSPCQCHHCRHCPPTTTICLGCLSGPSFLLLITMTAHRCANYWPCHVQLQHLIMYSHMLRNSGLEDLGPEGISFYFAGCVAGGKGKCRNLKSLSSKPKRFVVYNPKLLEELLPQVHLLPIDVELETAQREQASKPLFHRRWCRGRSSPEGEGDKHDCRSFSFASESFDGREKSHMVGSISCTLCPA